MTYATIRVGILNMEFETTGSCHIRQIDDTLTIDIVFEGTFVERNSEMVPLPKLNTFFQIFPFQIASHITRSTTTLLKRIVTVSIRSTWAEHFIDIAKFVVTLIEINMPCHLVYITRLAHKLLPLEGEDIRQIRLHILHQRGENSSS